MSRRYRGIAPATIEDPRLRDMLVTIDQWIRDADAGISRLPGQKTGSVSAGLGVLSDRGLSTSSGGAPEGGFGRGEIPVGLGAEGAYGLGALSPGQPDTFLRSTGQDPTWTGLSASDIPELTHANLANRQRSVFYPPELWSALVKSNAGVSPDITQRLNFGGTGAASYATTTIVCPADMASSGGVFVLYLASAGVSTNPSVWNLYSLAITASSSLTTSAYTQTDQAQFIPAGTAELIETFNIGSQSATNCSAGQPVRLVISRDPADVSDTNADSIQFLGLEFIYTADS